MELTEYIRNIEPFIAAFNAETSAERILDGCCDHEAS
jgi:hypothetical protein